MKQQTEIDEIRATIESINGTRPSDDATGKLLTKLFVLLIAQLTAYNSQYNIPMVCLIKDDIISVKLIDPDQTELPFES